MAASSGWRTLQQVGQLERCPQSVCGAEVATPQGRLSVTACVLHLSCGVVEHAMHCCVQQLASN